MDMAWVPGQAVVSFVWVRTTCAWVLALACTVGLNLSRGL